MSVLVGRFHGLEAVLAGSKVLQPAIARRPEKQMHRTMRQSVRDIFRFELLSARSLRLLGVGHVSVDVHSDILVLQLCAN
jgi:hypothetical protein